MKSVLVTGAHGFLGRHCAREFGMSGARVIGMGYGDWGEEDPRDYGIDRWIESGIDLRSLLEIGEKVDLIVHCAGAASVGRSFADPLGDFQSTVDTVMAVLEYMRVSEGCRMVFISSAAVYGCKEKKAIHEADSLDPVSPYGLHKKIAEELCASYVNTFGLDVSVVRFFSIYGPGLKKQLLWDATEKLSRAGSQVEFFGTGDETRDWIHVRDAARLVFCISHAAGDFKVFNGGSGRGVTVREVLEMLASALNCRASIVFSGQTKEGDPKHYCADIAGASGLGWAPQIALEAGIREYADWVQKGAVE